MTQSQYSGLEDYAQINLSGKQKEEFLLRLEINKVYRELLVCELAEDQFEELKIEAEANLDTIQEIIEEVECRFHKRRSTRTTR